MNNISDNSLQIISHPVMDLEIIVGGGDGLDFVTNETAYRGREYKGIRGSGGSAPSGVEGQNPW